MSKATEISKPMSEAEMMDFNLMLARNYRRLEYSLPELRLASIVLEAMQEDALSKPEEIHDLKRFDLTQDQWDGLTYAIHHIGNLARELEKTFYRGFRGPLDAECQ